MNEMPVISVPPFARLDEYVGAWAMEPRAAAALWESVSRMDLSAHVAQPQARVQSSARKVQTANGGKVAIVEAVGTLMKQESSSGQSTSTIQMRRDIRAAAADPEVSAILLAIDSPGGSVSGTDALASEIRDARAAKPVYAQVEDLGASAAYWLASQCERVYANSPTALVGSIGTVMTVYDRSGQAEQDGIKALVFSTGSLKGAGTPGAPVTPEQQKYFQQIVDQSQQSFDRAVQSGRGLTDAELAAVRTGEVFSASAALGLRLIDGIQTLDATVNALSTVAASRRQTRPAGAMQEHNMPRTLDPATSAAAETPVINHDIDGAKPRAHVSPDITAGADAAVAAMRSAVATEEKRIADIRAVCGRTPAIQAKAIADGWDATRAELESLRATRPQAPNINSGAAPADAAAIEASLCLSAGIPYADVARQFSAATMEAATSPRMRRMGISEVMHLVAAAHGRHLRPGRMDNDAIREVLEVEKGLRADFSTISLSGILSNLANKRLLQAYNAVESTATQFCGVGNLADFKAATRYRMTMAGEFEEVGQTGELKHTTLSEETYTQQLKTYGRIISLTRQMIINDDLGAFLDIPRMLGRASALKRELAAYTLLLSNPSNFFAAGHKNYLSGAGSVLSIAGLTAALQKFRDQQDTAGHPIGVSPKSLLVPSSLEVTAMQLFKETRVVGNSTTDKLLPASNPHAGMFTPLATPYLNNTAISGYSATGWYMLADPADVAVIEIGYLNGQQNPVIENGQANFDVLGMEWRGYFDFGVAVQDWRAGVLSAGV